MELLPDRLYVITFPEGGSWYARVSSAEDEIIDFDESGNRFVEPGWELALYKYATDRHPSTWVCVSRLTKAQVTEVTVNPWQKVTEVFRKVGDRLGSILD